jgi:hypothetical protein
MTPDPSSETPFSRLIREFASAFDHYPSSEMFGLEFEHEGIVASVLPHPRDEHRLIAEVVLGELDWGQIKARDEALLFLHQLNDRARREHDWVITVDDQMLLTLSNHQAVAGLDAARLQGLLDEGLGCAQALQSMWASISSGPEAQLTDFAAQAGTGMLRA